MSIVASLNIPTSSEQQQQNHHQQQQHTNDQNAIYIQKYYEHPLTAVTSAMLNMSAPVTEDNGIVTTATLNNNIQIAGSHQLQQIQNSNGSSYIYEYYKVPEKDGLQWRYVLLLNECQRPSLY